MEHFPKSACNFYQDAVYETIDATRYELLGVTYLKHTSMVGPLDMIDKVLLLEDTPEGRRKWRLTISVGIITLFAHVAWSCGMIPGVSGFAMANEQEEIKHTIIRIELKLLDRDIIDAVRQRCLATNKTFFADRVHELTRQWYFLTKVVYIVPNCTDL